MSDFNPLIDEAFLKHYLQFLSTDPLVRGMFHFDKCNFIADNYLLAMVFAYFTKANYRKADVTCINFLTALFLAHEVEEELDSLQNTLTSLSSTALNIGYDEFIKGRDALFVAINYKGIVSKEFCDEIMSIFPNNPIWERKRREDHAGYQFFQERRVCDMCISYMKEHIAADEEKKEHCRYSQESSPTSPEPNLDGAQSTETPKCEGKVSRTVCVTAHVNTITASMARTSLSDSNTYKKN